MAIEIDDRVNEKVGPSRAGSEGFDETLSGSKITFGHQFVRCSGIVQTCFELPIAVAVKEGFVAQDFPLCISEDLWRIISTLFQTISKQPKQLLDFLNFFIAC